MTSEPEGIEPLAMAATTAAAMSAATATATAMAPATASRNRAGVNATRAG
jgi:hypothetical protein